MLINAVYPYLLTRPHCLTSISCAHYLSRSYGFASHKNISAVLSCLSCVSLNCLMSVQNCGHWKSSACRFYACSKYVRLLRLSSPDSCASTRSNLSIHASYASSTCGSNFSSKCIIFSFP